MADITLLPSAKVPLIYEGDNTMTTEWYRFFWNIYGFTGTGVVPVDKGGTGLDTIGEHQVIIGTANNIFEPALLRGFGINITYNPGFVNLSIGDSGVIPGTYGSATQVGVFTVNQYGVLTAASNTSIGIDASQIVSGTIASARISGSYTGITGVGTLTVGTWNANTISAGYGGTGQSTYTIGDMLYATGATALSKLAIGASTYILASSGTAPQWVAPSSISIGTATNLAGGAANRIAYQTGPGATSFIVAPTIANTYLEWSGSAFQWSSNPLGTVTSVSVVSANGFAGTVATATTTPAITLTTTITGLLKGNGTAISAASSGTDYAPATSGTSILYGNGAGGFSNVAIGTGVSFVGGTLSATGSGGTVTSVSGTGTVNGITLTGTVTSSGSLTLGGTLSGIGNSQLTNSTISGVALGGNLFNLTAGTGVSFSTGTTYNGSAAITINATGTGGTVTSVAALTLDTTGTDLSSTVANSTTTPVITLNVPTASATNRGALSSADWTTFNSKAPGVTFTTGYIPFGQGTTTLNQDAALFWDNTNKRLGVGTASPSTLFHLSGTSTTAIARIQSTSNGTGSFTGAGAGIELTANGMNESSATYTPAIKFGSTDPDLTTTNPKFGAAILAKAAQTYNSDTTGGMDLMFWTSPINPGTGNGLAERMRIFASGGVSIGNTTDPGATNLSITGTAQAGNLKLDTNTLSTTDTNGNLTLSPNGTGYVALGGATPRILLTDTGTYTVQMRTVSGVAVVGSTNATPLALQTSGTTALYISTAQGVSIGNTTDAGASNLSVTGTGKFGTTVGVGAATPAASGAGITFPATQSASTDVNTLDDYEEGTFTPVVSGSTTAGAATYTAQIGRYTKIGNRVFITINLGWSAHTGTGNFANITGLPFTSANVTSSFASLSIYSDNLALTANNTTQAIIGAAATSIVFRQVPVGGGASAVIPLDTAVTTLTFSGHYETA